LQARSCGLVSRRLVSDIGVRDTAFPDAAHADGHLLTAEPIESVNEVFRGVAKRNPS
jgi:hypothetical protein